MELILETKTKNQSGNTMLLEKCSNDFYGFRWRGESLKWGYNVNDCGTADEVKNRLESLIEIEEELIEKYTEQDFSILVETEKLCKAMHEELLEAITKKVL